MILARPGAFVTPSEAGRAITVATTVAPWRRSLVRAEAGAALRCPRGQVYLLASAPLATRCFTPLCAGVSHVDTMREEDAGSGS